MSDAIRIEPCPFCGSTAFDVRCTAAEYATVEPCAIDGHLRVNVDGFGWYWVMCNECHAQGPKYYGKDHAHGITGPKSYWRDHGKTRLAIKSAIEAWNDRCSQTRMDLEGPA